MYTSYNKADNLVCMLPEVVCCLVVKHIFLLAGNVIDYDELIWEIDDSSIRSRDASDDMSSAITFSSAHRLRVKSLYKRSLKNALDWTIRRDLWRAEAMRIRAEFEANRCGCSFTILPLC
jgi:hypothetical protein